MNTNRRLLLIPALLFIAAAVLVAVIGKALLSIKNRQ